MPYVTVIFLLTPLVTVRVRLYCVCLLREQERIVIRVIAVRKLEEH